MKVKMEAVRRQKPPFENEKRKARRGEKMGDRGNTERRSSKGGC